ncbi:MAG: GSCFA domain-containing protein [Sulfitobacter sp.]
MANTPAPQDPISPYQGLDDRAFWRAGVVEAGSYPPPDIYRAKFKITKDMPIFTAGSCFAQHVGRTLAKSGYAVIDTEPLPAFVPEHVAHRHGYKLYSARFGNIYTIRQFLQLLQEAFGTFQPADPIWEKDGRYYDALRPGMTPGGLALPEHVTEAREVHLNAVREAVAQTAMVVFTLGLTETWQHVPSGTVYPTAPGTIAGKIDPDVHGFVNFRSHQIRKDFLKIRDVFQAANPDVKFLLTVSPVPLTATASDAHVLPATVYSKSVLRTVAGELSEDFEDVDYFPSYEIIAAHPGAARFFEPNLRSVKPRGVRRVMRTFLGAHEQETDPTAKRAKLKEERQQTAQTDPETDDGLICEEELLEAFRK